jgi:hypothetical protein
LIAAGKIVARKEGSRTRVDVESLKAYYAGLPVKCDKGRWPIVNSVVPSTLVAVIEQRVDARLAFLARAAARLELVEAGLMEVDEAFEGLVGGLSCQAAAKWLSYGSAIIRPCASEIRGGRRDQTPAR